MPERTPEQGRNVASENMFNWHRAVVWGTTMTVLGFLGSEAYLAKEAMWAGYSVEQMTPYLIQNIGNCVQAGSFTGLFIGAFRGTT